MSCILYETLFPDPVKQDLLELAFSLSPGGYEDALAEAARLEERANIPMTVEAIDPAHFRLSDYRLRVGDTVGTLRENTALYPVGIWSIDHDFEAMKWYRGAKTEYLFDWMTVFVADLLQKTQTMFPQPTFKAGETFTFTVVSSVAKAHVDAWLLGYAVLPETMAEMPIIR